MSTRTLNNLVCANVSREYLEKVFDMKITSQQLEDDFRFVLNYNCDQIVSQYNSQSFSFGQLISRANQSIKDIRDIPLVYVQQRLSNVKYIILSILTKSYNSFVTREIKWPQYPKLEILANIFVAFGSFNVSYSAYFTGWPSGRKFLLDTFSGKDKIQTALAWTIILYNISMLKMKEELLFRKEFDVLFKPQIEFLAEQINQLIGYMSESDIKNLLQERSLWLATNISTRTFALAVLAIVNRIEESKKQKEEDEKIREQLLKERRQQKRRERLRRRKSRRKSNRRSR